MTHPDTDVAALAEVIHAECVRQQGFCLHAGDVTFCHSWARLVIGAGYVKADPEAEFDAPDETPAGGSSTDVNVRATSAPSEAATAPSAGQYHDRRFAPSCRNPWNGDDIDTQSPNCWCPQDALRGEG